ncbi:MAG: hypothetical protein WD100_01285 [Tistlia sp.]|uniref:hypothetical protein n=1 Tax=Tistlia sp. TaxID=3057121 RepID=UPI0034A4B47B
MARSTFLPLLAAAALAGGAALPAYAQSTTTTTTTTTTKSVGGITSRTTVTEETSVLGEPSDALEIDRQAVPAPGTAVQSGTSAAVTGAPSAQDEVMTRDGIRYACTGVALDSREDPRWRAFPAKLVFTVKGGGYLPDVLTRIEDRQGKAVFTAKCDGPWLLVDLPADRYRVVATAEDPQGRVHQRTADISVGAGRQSETIIRFDEIPG